jgi:thiosulfate reductase/polysulfide reductase chain A
MKSGVEIKRSICTLCGTNCGLLVYVQDGKVVKVQGNPDYPASLGYTCKRPASAVYWLYHPDQLKYPLKRVGNRGEGKWQRIGYEEALDEIAERLKELKEKYGAETVGCIEGTLRYGEFWMRSRFMNLFGSPNTFQAGVICGFNREMTDSVIAGFRLCGKMGNLEHTRCAVIQGQNPKGFEPKQAQQIRRIKEIEPGRLRLIVIDPRDTGLATEETDMLLMIRPGTDAALMLGWLNVIINEELYDKDFVKNYTYGFDKLAERVQEYPPQRVADITGIATDKIVASARVFATTKPANIMGGQSPDSIGFNSTRVEQASGSVMAITGNVDIPGARFIPMHPGVVINGKWPVRDSELELTDKLSQEQKAKQVGSDRFKLATYVGYNIWSECYYKTFGVVAPTMHTLSAHTPTMLRGIINGDPNRIRAFLSWDSNLLVRDANTKLIYQALKSPNLELHVVVDYRMTPQAQLADYVMPCASYLERPYYTTWEDNAPTCCFGEKAVEPLGERRDDYHFWRGLGIRLGQKEYWPWETHEELMEYRGAPIGYGDFEKLIKTGGLAPPVEFKKYEKHGFATRTGKIELYSTVLEELGYDPLPYYREPPESPISTPEVAKEYPLILITGGRSGLKFHSEHLLVGVGMRERHTEPIMDIHPETAQKLGISDGDWVYIETRRGRIKQKAYVTNDIRPDTVNCEASWWFPEMPSEEPCLSGIWESNVNILTIDDLDACDELVGGTALTGLLCKVYKA